MTGVFPLARKLGEALGRLDTIDPIEPVRIPELPRVSVEIVKLDPEIWGEGINDFEGECCSAAPRSHPSDHAPSGHGASRFDRISQGEE